MRLKHLVWALLLAGASALGASLDSSSLYITTPLKWERAQRPNQPAQRFAHGRILAIASDGNLATISCLLYRGPDRRLNIIYSEGYGLSSGTWRKTNGQLMVRLRSIHSSVPKLGESARQQEKEEFWSYGPDKRSERLAAWIKIGNERFVPLKDLSGIDKLGEIIEFHRREPDRSR